MLEIGAFFLRTETELILKSRRVVPRRLLDSGFEFRFPFFRDALVDLEKQVRRSQTTTTKSASRIEL
jgi:NAD dependent epimerase/dehydratase family enzyme